MVSVKRFARGKGKVAFFFFHFSPSLSFFSFSLNKTSQNVLATPERASDEVNLARWHTERVLIGQGREWGGVGGWWGERWVRGGCWA